MSGQDNSDFGFHEQFGLDASTNWEAYFEIPPEDNEGYEFMEDLASQNHNNAVPTVPVQENLTLDGMALNGAAGSVNGDVNPSQFSDLPMFTEPMSNSPLVNANQADDLAFHTTPPAQDIDVQPMSNTLLAQPNAGGSSPIDFGFDVNNNGDLDLINNTASADQHSWPKPYPLYASQYSSTHTPMPTFTAPQGHYPIPVQQTEWPNLERTLFQQGGQAMVGADTIDPSRPADVSHLAAPPAPRKLTPKPALDVGATAPMAQGSFVVPVKKDTQTQQPATKTKPKKPTVSKAKQTAVKQPIDNSELLVSTFDDAKAIAIERIQLQVVNDDRDDVAAHPKVWVLKIAKALDIDFRTQAEEHDRLTEEGRAEFTRWQVEHENKAWAILSDKEDVASFAQSCAWLLYDKALELHQLGLEDVGKTIANGGADLTSKCSQRINAAITAIEEYSIVKYDFLRQDRLEALLANPSGFTCRKRENCWVNYKKKKTVGPVKTENEEKVSRAAPEAKSQGKKRKQPSPPTSDDESEEEDEVEGESDEEFVQRTKRTKRH